MRSLLQAALVLAPALVRSVSLPSPSESFPSSFITLQLPDSDESVATSDLSFRFDVLESRDACGYANVTVNGHTLPQGGRGSLSTYQGVVLVANWNFTCVSWNDEPREQLMSLNVDYVDGKAVADVGFTIRFQQVAPVWVSGIEGSASMTRIHGMDNTMVPLANAGSNFDLEGQLAELELLRQQVAELKHLIFMKEQHLVDSFGWSDKDAQKCDSLKCVVQSLFRQIRGAVVAFYGDLTGHDGLFDDHPKPPHWRHPKFGKPGCGHGNHTHGNHTFPHPPPWRRPHRGHRFPYPPPFCRCPPPPPPHHPPHHPKKPPHRRPDEEFNGWPSPFDDPKADEHPIAFNAFRPPPLDDELERPVPPDAPFPPDDPDRPGRHGPPGPPGRHGGPRPPPPPPPHRPLYPRLPHPRKIIVSAILLVVLITVLRKCCCSAHGKSRAERRCRRQARREARRERRAARRQAFGARIKAFLGRFTLGRFLTCDDEEKAVMMRQPPESESELSTTMEQEIAQFRAAADVVGDIVAAEEGRAHQQVRERQQHIGLVPPSPGAFAEYMLDDDVLPAYGDGRRSISADGAVVTDGFRYTPGSSHYTPSSSGSVGGGADDVLGDTKH